MMTSNWKRFALITAIFAVLSLVHIFAGLNCTRTLRILTKVLPILFLCFCVFLKRGRSMATAALVSSFLGDFIPETGWAGEWGFMSMVFFFAIAQICYICEFSAYTGRKTRGFLFIIPVFLIPITSVLPADFSVPIACTVYGILVLGNIFTASRQKRAHKLLFVTGALIFLISDSTILLRMLGIEIPFAAEFIMSTYFLAQYLLNIVVIVL